MLAERFLDLHEASRLETRVPDSGITGGSVHPAPVVHAVCQAPDLPGSPCIVPSLGRLPGHLPATTPSSGTRSRQDFTVGSGHSIM